MDNTGLTRDEKLLNSFYSLEENKTLLAIYRYVREAEEHGSTYSIIAQRLNPTPSSGSKRNSQKKPSKVEVQSVAHHCKKLEKVGFVRICSHREKNEKWVFHSRYAQQNSLKQALSGEVRTSSSIPDLYTNIYAPDIKKKSVVKKRESDSEEEVEDVARNKQDKPFKWRRDPDMTVRENIIDLLREGEVHQRGGATNWEICSALGESNFERVLSRMLEELSKSRQLWKQQQYRYLAFPQKKEEKKEEIKSKVEEVGRLEEQKKETLRIGVSSQLRLNPRSYGLIREKVGEVEDREEKEVVRGFLREAILKLETMTVETLNRYIFTLNIVERERVVSALDLKLKIRKELEGQMGWEIDKKTVLKILTILSQEGLLRMKEFDLHSRKEDEDEEGDTFCFKRVLVIPPNLDFQSQEVQQHRAIKHPHFKSELTLDRIHAMRSIRDLQQAKQALERKEKRQGRERDTTHKIELKISRKAWMMRRFFSLKILERAYQKLKREAMHKLRLLKEAGESRKMQLMCQRLERKALLTDCRGSLALTEEFIKETSGMVRSEFEKSIWEQVTNAPLKEKIIDLQI